MFREVNFPQKMPGKLFLHSMPGRFEPLAQVFDQLTSHRITSVSCLAGDREIGIKSPEYLQALENGSVPRHVMMTKFPIPDYGIPGNCDALWVLAGNIGNSIQSGENVLIHCAAGIGRTGMLAECVLVALGHDTYAAHRMISAAGSGADTQEQRDLIAWCAAQPDRRK